MTHAIKGRSFVAQNAINLG